MTFRNASPMARSLTAALILLALCCFPRTGYGADLKNDMKNVLAIYDQEFLASFKLDLKVSQPTSIKSMHGRSRALVSYCGGQQGKFMQMENASRDAVKFDSNAGSSYDAQHNQLLAVDKKVSIALEGNDWRVRRDRESLTIDSTAKVLAKKDLAPMLEAYPTGHHDAANLFYRYILALGRGYSQLLDDVTTVILNDDGSYTVKANGKLFSPYCGEWTLVVDPAADYLVREAKFIRAGQAAPCFTSKSSGTQAGTVPLHSKGTVSIVRYIIDVEVLAYSNNPDEEMATKTHERVAYDAPAADAVATDAAVAADAVATGTLAIDAMAQTSYQALFPKETVILNFNNIDGDGMPLVQKRTR